MGMKLAFGMWACKKQAEFPISSRFQTLSPWLLEMIKGWCFNRIVFGAPSVCFLGRCFLSPSRGSRTSVDDSSYMFFSIFICLLQVVTRVFSPDPYKFLLSTSQLSLLGVLSNTMIFGSVWTWGLPEHGSFRVHMIRHQLLGCLIFRQNQQGHAVFFTTCGPRRGSTWHWSWMKRSGTLSWFGIHGKYLRIVQDQVTTISQKSCGQDELDEQVSDDCGCVSKWSASHWYPQVHWPIIIFCLITYNSHLG